MRACFFFFPPLSSDLSYAVHLVTDALKLITEETASSTSGFSSIQME